MEKIPKMMNIIISTAISTTVTATITATITTTITTTNLVEDLKMARAEGALMEVEDFPLDLSSCCNIRLEHTNRCDATEDYF